MAIFTADTHCKVGHHSYVLERADLRYVQCKCEHCGRKRTIWL